MEGGDGAAFHRHHYLPTINMGKKIARNDITHDKIKTKPQTEQYRNGWERIFKKRKQEHAKKLAKKPK